MVKCLQVLLQRGYDTICGALSLARSYLFATVLHLASIFVLTFRDFSFLTVTAVPLLIASLYFWTRPVLLREIVGKFILCTLALLGLGIASTLLLSMLFGEFPEVVAFVLGIPIFLLLSAYYICLLARIVAFDSFDFFVPMRIFTMVLSMLLLARALEFIFSFGLRYLLDTLIVEILQQALMAITSTVAFVVAIIVYKEHYLRVEKNSGTVEDA